VLHCAGYTSVEQFDDGLVVATWVGAIVVALGAVTATALLIPRKPRRAGEPVHEAALDAA
jgi:hypothetical protein